jgi:hypothetical protein
MNKELVELLNIEDKLPDIPKPDFTSDEEWNFARKNIMDTIANGNEALKELLEIAKAAQHPGAYEMIVGLVKELVNGNKVLLETKRIDQQIKNDINKGSQPTATDQTAKTINNNMFFGTTAEFAKMIEEQKKKVIDGEIIND